MQAVLTSEGKIDEEAYLRLYENRLLPGLIQQNNQATKPLFVNIPGISTNNFCTDAIRPEIRAAFPRIL